METYVFLKRALEKGALAELLSDGANPEVQEQGIGELGGTVLAQHAVSGAYDFVLVTELPDAGAAGNVSIRCNGRGVRTQALRAYFPPGRPPPPLKVRALRTEGTAPDFSCHAAS